MTLAAPFRITDTDGDSLDFTVTTLEGQVCVHVATVEHPPQAARTGTLLPSDIARLADAVLCERTCFVNGTINYYGRASGNTNCLAVSNAEVYFSRRDLDELLRYVLDCLSARPPVLIQF